MTDEPTPVPDLDEAPGWIVTDADGNVVDSGPLTEALPASGVGESAPAEGDE
jgi:hypothetical protein